MIELPKRNQWLWIYIICVSLAFIPGFFIPQFLPEEIRLDLQIVDEYSIFSGLFIAGYVLTIITSLRFLKITWRGKFEHRAAVIVLTILLLLLAAIIYPGLSCFWTEWLPVKILSYMEKFERVFPAFLMSLAGLNVFLLGFNAKYIGENKEKRNIIRFLILEITLISLISIAVSFAFGGVGGSLSSSDRRAMIFGSSLIIPIATYALGYLSKLITLRIIKVIALVLSLIISFLLSMILYAALESNIFVFQASITIFLAEGFWLALKEME